MIVLSLGRLKLGLGWRADPVLFSLTLLQPGYRSPVSYTHLTLPTTPYV